MKFISRAVRKKGGGDKEKKEEIWRNIYVYVYIYKNSFFFIICISLQSSWAIAPDKYLNCNNGLSD